VARLFAVTGVIIVHTTSLTSDPASTAAGGILIVLHVTREVFLFLSAFVLAYSAGGRPLGASAFWRRRMPLVAIPYAVWTAIYLVADGHYLSGPAMVERFAWDLLTSGARFHLYFLRLTLQLYVAFPVLLSWVDRVRPGRLLAGVAVFQLAFTTAIHYRLRLPAPAGTWLTHPGSWLPSYALYVVAGIVAARHYQALAAWLEAHARLLAGLTCGAVVLGIGSYFADTRIIGLPPVRASEVFQPVVVIESLAVIAALIGLGLHVGRRAGPQPLARLQASSDVSFGVYLAHPLVLQGLIAAGGAVAVLPSHPALTGAPLLAAVAVLVPLTYLLTVAAVSVARRTPVSGALTGRPASPRRPQRKEPSCPTDS
jgi:membrane-bound acyltransferase YfiQ involved in biofilm formation